MKPSQVSTETTDISRVKSKSEGLFQVTSNPVACCPSPWPASSIGDTVREKQMRKERDATHGCDLETRPRVVRGKGKRRGCLGLGLLMISWALLPTEQRTHAP
jgi:hypothetical protein